MISFVVPGNPIPWERVRSRGGARFTAPRTREAERAVKLYALKAGARPIEGPVKLEARFYRASAVPCDVDNLVKLVQDALNGVAFRDDRQIVRLSAYKAIDRDNPRTEVTVEAA